MKCGLNSTSILPSTELESWLFLQLRICHRSTTILFVKDMNQRGYAVFGYLLVVPIDEISQAFKQGDAEKKEDATVHKDSDSSDSD
ncbi:unnamed protein product [Dovyalis caffra]|uniref:Uncharacterized protein n=1 Tax=Dovyalis caffra TaxID=77055 RepID=A0AAV1RHE9_9ROSI|nr:unnamed protein product [Dovyalis caffra]